MGRSGRRRWTAEDKRRIVEETRAPGASVSVVARRHDINANLLFKWKRLEEAGEPDRPLLLGPEFVPIGVVGRTDDGGPALLARMPGVADGHRQNGSGEPRGASGLESRAGVIEIDLPDGACIRVDAFVDGRALARVLSALKRCR
ncbi:MAG TPA: transposase [Geminicoccaceae bacterium]|jgi:transposase|nr:transposase [Geminicoccaceae bacterium]